FPPGEVGSRLCVDGGVIDNLPVAQAAQNADVVIAVDVGSSDLVPTNDIITQGFASIYMRAATTMMHALQQYPLVRWDGPPMLLIRRPPTAISCTTAPPAPSRSRRSSASRRRRPTPPSADRRKQMPRRSGTRPASRCPLKRLSRHALVGFHCRVQLGHRHPLVVAMSDVDRSGTEQVRASPLRQLG